MKKFVLCTHSRDGKVLCGLFFLLYFFFPFQMKVWSLVMLVCNISNWTYFLVIFFIVQKVIQMFSRKVDIISSQENTTRPKCGGIWKQSEYLFLVFSFKILILSNYYLSVFYEFKLSSLHRIKWRILIENYNMRERK